MGQTAAVLADATAEHKRVDAGAIHQVAVVPVVDAGADDDRAFATGMLGRAGPFAGELQQIHIAAECRCIFPDHAGV